MSQSLSRHLWLASPSEAEVCTTAELLESVEDVIRRYIVVGDNEIAALSLYVLHTWAIDAAYATPYLVIESPERGSGKSRLLEVLAMVVRRPWHTASASEAALFRRIERDEPTLLLDEADALFASGAERSEPLRAVLNAGNRRGACVSRMVGQGAKMDVRDFAVFCPKVVAGIATTKMPDTITDRSIRITMQRRRSSEPVERLIYHTAYDDLEPLRESIETWCSSSVDALRAAKPTLPTQLTDRMCDAWEPLLAIADTAGDQWSARAHRIAVELCTVESGDELGGAQLLAAIRRAMGDQRALATETILASVNGDEESAFGGWNSGTGLKARDLAKFLKPYGVKSKTVRLGDKTVKGYHADDLALPWECYLPATPDRDT